MAKQKSKRNLSYSINGELDVENMKIVEYVDDEELVYDLEAILSQFHGQNISFSLKVTSDLESDG